jgi:hypothetical protein
MLVNAGLTSTTGMWAGRTHAAWLSFKAWTMPHNRAWRHAWCAPMQVTLVPTGFPAQTLQALRYLIAPASEAASGKEHVTIAAFHA